MIKDKDSMGKAYGFFYFNGKEQEIQEQLPKARAMESTPNDLELKLSEGINPEQFDDDAELKDLAYQALRSKNNYLLIASLPNATNKKTAHELGDIKNSLYHSSLQSKFHKDGEKFLGGIIYKEGENYEFLE